MAAANLRRVSVVLSIAVMGAISILASGEVGTVDLLDLYTRARELDPTVQAARYERQIAAEAVRESRAHLRPVVNANLESAKTYQDIRQSDNPLFALGETDFASERYSISLTQPLYRLEALRRIPQARALEKRAVGLLVSAEQDLIVRLAEAHFNYLAARDTLEFATAERMAIWRQLEETEQRLRSGLANIVDLNEARARFAVSQASETEALDRLEDSRQALAEITGDPPVELQTLSEAFPLVGPDQPDVGSWVEAALFQNPGVTAREAAVEAALQELRRQQAERRPTVDLVTSYGMRDSGGTTFGGSGGTEIQTTELALRVGIPIYSGGRNSALGRTAVLRRRIALQELEIERRRVERVTRAAFQGVVSGIARVEALQKSVFAQEATVALKEEGMRSGLNTGLDVLDARRELFLAKRNLTRQRYDYILNGLRLKQAAGTLGIDDLRQISTYLQ